MLDWQRMSVVLRSFRSCKLIPQSLLLFTVYSTSCFRRERRMNEWPKRHTSTYLAPTAKQIICPTFLRISNRLCFKVKGKINIALLHKFFSQKTYLATHTYVRTMPTKVWFLRKLIKPGDYKHAACF